VNPPPSEDRCDVCGERAFEGRGGVRLCGPCAWIVDGGDWLDQLIATIARYPQLFDRLSVERLELVARRLRERGVLDKFVGLSDREAVGLALTTREGMVIPAKPRT
jgi:hypothetical protein